MKPSLTKQQALHILKVAVYAGLSAVIAKLISLIVSDPSLFGPLTPIVNVALVMLQKLFSEE